MVTGLADQDIAIESLKKGAFDYITKPIDFNHMEDVIGIKMIQISPEKDS